MSDIVAFIRARLDEDERYAQSIPGTYEDAGVTREFEDCGGLDGYGREKRMLDDIAAKRRILDLHVDERGGCRTCLSDRSDFAEGWIPDEAPCATSRCLALPFADHPDYDEAWRP